MYTLDEDLVSNLKSYLATVFSVISTIAVISGITPMFMVCLIPVIIYYMRQQVFFTVNHSYSGFGASFLSLIRSTLSQVTYRELKRLDSVSRSPIYALLGETLDGVSTIRAFGAETTLADRLTEMLDKQQHAYYLTCTAQNWLAVRLELVGTLIITFACLSAVVEHITIGPDEKFAGLAGLSISFALSVTQSLNWSVRMGSDFEASMISVERIVQYCTIKSEAPRTTEVDRQNAGSWPSGGEIDFQGVTLSYRPGLPLVLKGLNILIPPSSKVGVVGRTGKSNFSLLTVHAASNT
jgi:ATP-binding cassette subfamily C (CFTR/MRP) protein 1